MDLDEEKARGFHAYATRRSTPLANQGLRWTLDCPYGHYRAEAAMWRPSPVRTWRMAAALCGRDARIISVQGQESKGVARVIDARSLTRQRDPLRPRLVARASRVPS